jgi:hypothetical protein
LLHFSKVICWISVQYKLTYLDKRKISMWAYLGNIPNIKTMIFSLLGGHYLHF